MAGIKSSAFVVFAIIIPKAPHKEINDDTNFLSIFSFLDPFSILFLMLFIMAKIKHR